MSEFSQKLTSTQSNQEVNVLSPPLPFEPAKADGISDDSSLINNLLHLYDKVFIPSGKSYGITQTITVPKGKSLYSRGSKAHLKLLTKNIPAIEINHLSAVEKIKINLPSENTIQSSCGIKINLSSESTRASVKDIEVAGSDDSGNGIYVGGNSGRASFSVLENLYFERVNYGLYVDVKSPAYANSFIVNNIVTRSSIGLFYLRGSSANTFTNIAWNTGYFSSIIVDCDTQHNCFQGFFYDLQDSPNSILAKWGTNATRNILKTTLQGSTKIIDDSSNKLNYLNADREEVVDIVKKISYLPSSFLTGNDVSQVGYWSRYKPYGGIQENVLVYGDKIHTVNLSKLPSNSRISSLFDPYSRDSSEWIIENGEEIQIEIILKEPTFTAKRVDFIEVVFATEYEAKKIKLETFDDKTLTWKVLRDITENNKRFAVYHDDVIGFTGGGDVTKIRFTFGNPRNISGLIKIDALIARVMQSAGTAFLPRNGGKLHGDIDLTKNKLKNCVLDQSTSDNRPLSPVKGQMFYDITINKPIWFNGLVWIDAFGTPV